MATTYTCTLDISVRKQHQCAGCGGKFSYMLVRKIKGTGGSEEAASQNAQSLAIAALEHDVDHHPCPVCGLVQPDMVAKTRKSRVTAGLWLGLIGVAVAFILGLAHFVPISTCALIATLSLGLSLAVIAWGCIYNPNGLPSANLPLAQMNLSSGKLFLDQPATGVNPTDHHFALSGKQATGLALVLAALVAVLLPLAVSTILGWPRNSAWVTEVVGPGDKACFYLREKLTSCKGYWSGSAGANVVNKDEFQPPLGPLSAETKQSNWGQTISGKSVSNQTQHMYAYITIPPMSDLAHKSLTLDVSTNVNFPFMVGRSFTDDNRAFQEQTTVHLATVGAGDLYYKLFWMGHVSAVVLLGLGYWLASSACTQLSAAALPTQIFPQGTAPT